MSTGRPCTICCNAKKLKLAREMIAAGDSDQAIADAVGGINRMAVSRHRRQHVMAPARALAEAAGKGREAIEQRAQIAAAIDAGDPSAWVMLSNIVSDLRKVHERLERVAGEAEADQQRMAVASLSAQQLRAAEVRAKLGDVGGYSGAKTPELALGVQFAVNIIFSDQRRQTISTSTMHDASYLPSIKSN